MDVHMSQIGDFPTNLESSQSFHPVTGGSSEFLSNGRQIASHLGEGFESLRKDLVFTGYFFILELDSTE